MTFNPTTDAALVLRLDDQSTFAVNADGSGGTPANNAPCNYWSDLSGNAVNAVLSTIGGALAPTYLSNALGGKPGLDFHSGSQLALGLAPSALAAAQSGGNWTVLIALKYTANGPNGALGFAFNCGPPWEIGVQNNGELGSDDPGYNEPDYGAYGVFAAYSGRLAAPGEFATVAVAYDALANGGSLPVSRVSVNGMGRKCANGVDAVLGGQNFYVGGINPAGGGAQSWPGILFAVYVYSRTLSQAEVLEWDLYIRGRYSQPHPVAASGVFVVSDGDSVSGNGEAYLWEQTALDLGIPLDCWSNLAWGGKTTTIMTARAAADVDPLLAAFGGGVRKILAYQEGENELGLGPAAVASNLEAYGLARKSAAWPWVVCGTVTPYGFGQDNSGYPAAANVTLRADFAGHVGFADALADVGGDAIMGDPEQVLGGSNFSGKYRDVVHFAYAGDVIAAPYYAAAITAGLAPATKFPPLLLFQTPGGY